MLKRRFVTRPQVMPRPRRGISLTEVVVAMTLLAFVIGSLGLLAAKNAARARALDAMSARTFALTQQANRFSVLPYDSIPMYVGTAGVTKVDTLAVGRYRFWRRVTYTPGITGAEYRTVRVIIVPMADTTKRDSLVFQRAKTYARSPLFT